MLGAVQAGLLGIAKETRGSVAANTVFLAHLDDISFADEIGTYPVIKRTGDEILDTAYAFDAGSFKKLADGTGLSAQGAVSDFLKDSMTWTIDFWLRLGAYSYRGAILSCTTGGTYAGFLIYNSSNGNLSFLMCTGSSWNVNFSMAFAQNTEKFISVERTGAVLRIYVDGALVHTNGTLSTNSLSGAVSDDLEILWRKDQPAYTPNAWIDELRVSNIARYQGIDFTPPTVPYEVD